MRQAGTDEARDEIIVGPGATRNLGFVAMHDKSTFCKS